MAVLSEIPSGLSQCLANPPAAGNRNVWLFTVALRARHIASPEKVRALLTAVASQWNDRDFEPEIDRAIARAFNEKTQASGINSQASTRLPWPEFNPEAWNRRLDCPVGFSEKPLPITSEEVVDALFPEDALICAALDTRSAITQEREAWRGKESGMQFIVANPMIAKTGMNQSGKQSNRCHDNATKDRTYLVVEFDRGSLSEQAAILSSLHSSMTQLVLVVWSGGKSLHGWFNIQALPDYAKLRFFRHAVYLGADATLWDPAKLVRMPGGRRASGETQHIFHFQPSNSQ